MLFEKIRQFGYETEYPCRLHGALEGFIDVISNGSYLDRDDDYCSLSSMEKKVGAKLYDKYSEFNPHWDGDGCELDIPHPLPYTDFVEAVKTLNDDLHEWASIGSRCVDNNLFMSNRAGVHIRLDVTDWTWQERLRFYRLLSYDMQGYSDYTAFIGEKVFGRGFDKKHGNYNNPCEYASYYNSYLRVKDSTNTWGSDKFATLRAEHNRFGEGVSTYEIRGFGVPDNTEDALAQIESIRLLCKIVEDSLLDDRDVSIPEKLYTAFSNMGLVSGKE